MIVPLFVHHAVYGFLVEVLGKEGCSKVHFSTCHIYISISLHQLHLNCCRELNFRRTKTQLQCLHLQLKNKSRPTYLFSLQKNGNKVQTQRSGSCKGSAYKLTWFLEWPSTGTGSWKFQFSYLQIKLNVPPGILLFSWKQVNMPLKQACHNPRFQYLMHLYLYHTPCNIHNLRLFALSRFW